MSDQPVAQAGLKVPAGPLRPLLLPLCKAFEWIAMVMLVVATSAIMTEVVARGVLQLGLPAVGELARYAGLGVIFLAVPLLLARGMHVKVDMLHRMATGPLHRAIAIVNEMATFVFCVAFLVSCWWFMQRAGRFSTPALNMPNLWYYLPAIAGMALTTLVSLDRVFGIVLGREVTEQESHPC
ncbi:MAG: TRAP transporter small permease subunit [Burkholderiaceae bacterium]